MQEFVNISNSIYIFTVYLLNRVLVKINMFKNIFVTSRKLICLITELLKKASSRHASLRPIKILADDWHFFKILQRTRPVASGSILNLQSRWLNPRALPRPNGKSRPRERLLQLSVSTTEMLSTYRKARCSHLVLVFFCDYYLSC